MASSVSFGYATNQQQGSGKSLGNSRTIDSLGDSSNTLGTAQIALSLTGLVNERVDNADAEEEGEKEDGGRV